jgi:hypothetical protein
MPPKRERRQDDPDRPDEEVDAEEDPEAVDPDVKDIFDQAQELDYGRGDVVRKLKAHTDKTPELTGGDVDAAWEYADVGEEAVGGQNPTPDQSVVDEQGKAVGITYENNEPLHTEDKLDERDREPWELNPASSPDYGERVHEEFDAPVARPETEAGLSTTAGTTSAAPQPEKQKERRGKRGLKSGARGAKNKASRRPVKTAASKGTRRNASRRNTKVKRKAGSVRTTRKKTLARR